MTRIWWPGTAPDADAPVLGDDQVGAILSLREELMGPRATGSALVGAEVGSGKTVLISEVIIACRDQFIREHGFEPRMLIVGPRDVYGQWRDTLAEQSGGEIELRRIDSTKPGRHNFEAMRGITTPGETGVYYIGLEYLRAQDWESHKQTGIYKRMLPLDLIVSDEAHKHSNRATQALKTMRSIPTARKLALSGTFFGNKFENAWTITRWLWPEARDAHTGDWIITPNQRLWQANWCRVEVVRGKSGYAVRNPRTGGSITKVVSELRPGEFVKTLPCYVYLPNPIGDAPEPDIIRVPMTPIQQSQYEEMEAQSLAWLVSETGARTPLVADLPIVQRIRLRTAALGEMKLVGLAEIDESGLEYFKVTFDEHSKSNKLSALHSVLHSEEFEFGRAKSLILTHSKEFADETFRRMSRKYPGLVGRKTGDTSSAEWDETKCRFMLPEGDPEAIRWLIGTSAIGTGTDGLQHQCSRVVVLSRWDSSTDNLQGQARIWRRGVDVKNYHAVEIQSVGTIDMEVEKKDDARRESMRDSIRSSD